MPSEALAIGLHWAGGHYRAEYGQTSEWVHRIDDPDVFVPVKTALPELGNAVCYQALVGVLDSRWATGCPDEGELGQLATDIFGFILNRARTRDLNKQIAIHTKAFTTVAEETRKYWHSLDDFPDIQREIANAISRSEGVDPNGPRPSGWPISV